MTIFADDAPCKRQIDRRSLVAIHHDVYVFLITLTVNFSFTYTKELQFYISKKASIVRRLSVNSELYIYVYLLDRD
jgi:hypothetical protein